VAMANLITHNQTADDKGDPALFRDLFNRIHLPPGHPDKVDFYQQIIQPDVANRLTMTQINQLRQEIDRDETPGGRSLNQLRVGAGKQVELYFKTNPMFTAQPDRQIMATMKWQEDAARKIDEYVAAKKDVRSLFMLESPDSIVSQKYLQTYINSTPAQGLAQGAAAVVAGQQPAVAPVAMPKDIDTPAKLDAWIRTLPPNVTRFVDPEGKVRAITSRPAAQPAATGMLEPGNIDLNNRPVVKNADGSISTVRSMSFNENGKEVLIPTVAADGSGILSNDKAIEQYRKTGQFLGKFATPEAATQYALQLHQDQARQYLPTMDATGKIVPPKAAPAAETEIQMPTLITKETQEQKRERLKREADVRNTDAGVAMVGAAVGAVKGAIKGVEAVGRAGHAVGTAVADVAENLNPTEQQRVVTSFRTMIKSGTYTVASEPIILDALDTGLLTGPEQRVATKMLRALRGAK